MARATGAAPSGRLTPYWGVEPIKDQVVIVDEPIEGEREIIGGNRAGNLQRYKKIGGNLGKN